MKRPVTLRSLEPATTRRAGRRSLLVWGAGGHSRVVCDVANTVGYDVVGYVDRFRSSWRGTNTAKNRPIVIEEDTFIREPEDALRWASAMAIAIGDNASRFKAFELAARHFELPPLIHTSAVVSPSASIGPGTVVMPAAVVNAGALVGPACIINTASVIEHDCVLGTSVHISPHATLAGSVSVGDYSWIGAGATVIQGLRVGASCTLGAGAVATREIPDNTIAVGVPARTLHSNR